MGADPGHRRQLVEDGYCLVPSLLDAAMLAELRAMESRLLAQVDATHRQDFRYQGSNIYLEFQDPALGRLYAWPPALAALRDLGCPGAKWQSGFLISKPPGGPALYWHQDWAAWDHPVSAREQAPQLFLMYYLVDTTPENGCLRVIPGSHRRRTALHDQLTPAHEGATTKAGADAPIFADPAEAVDVPVRAGDLVIGDSRLLHAAHPNRSEHARTVLTLWYYPDFDALPEELRALFGRRGEQVMPPGFPDVRHLLATYGGALEAEGWNRVPGRHLRG